MTLFGISYSLETTNPGGRCDPYCPTGTHSVAYQVRQLLSLVSKNWQGWHGTALVLDPGGLQVLDQVEEVLTGHCVSLVRHNGLWVWGTLVVDTRALWYMEKGVRMRHGAGGIYTAKECSHEWNIYMCVLGV